MAERSFVKKAQTVVSQTKKRPSSSSKAERSKRAEVRPQVKSASGPTKKDTDDLFAKEEQYKILNAELEAKTADIVRQAEQLMREQSEVLSKPLSTLLLTDIEDEDNSRVIKPQQWAVQEPCLKAGTKKRVTSGSQSMCTGKQGKESHFKAAPSKVSHADELAAVEDSADFFLTKTIRSMEEKMNDSVALENAVEDNDVTNAGDNVGSGVSDAQIRVLKAKLRIMQEELDQLSCEYYKKDDENAKLCAKIKELEEDRARLQRTTSIQQTQIEKHRALAEESAKKCDGLQLQVSGLHKEIENLNRSNKQAAATHSTVEVRLNRALEEVERLKTQLNKIKQMNKEKISEEHQSKENLLAENKMLRKQKAELIMGFKKQLKLIDILKRQKMHFEAAKLLSFTEDEFMKALDWGKS
ncbi:testis-expressed sequence 9 protein [Lates japonicus]|uniref:Testis-expressed sequence 9 protein n=1 Tax=Lates japonicus TaxID=270547 RepID=A0AAD3MNQ1_LATJO|nr:testis-expressed sequence 9 protein [Lates japonicus]